MALTELIRFRYLDHKITDNEFFAQFVKTVGRKVIVDSLFRHFKSNPNSIKPLTQIQSDIIVSRKSKPKQIKARHIDEIPSELIGNIGSFLNYTQYFRLAQCNRNIYISMYSPPQIHRLNLNMLCEKYPKPMCLNAFKNVKSLVLDIRAFNGLSPSNQATWSNNDSLNKLRLCNKFGDQNDINLFIQNQHLINCSNVKILKLMSKSSIVYEAASIIALLSRFTKLEHLSAFALKVYNNHSYNHNNIANLFPNVQKLRFWMVATQFSDNFIAALHDQLETLHVIRGACRMNSVTFPKLHSLKLLYPDRNTVNAFRNVTSLKVVDIGSVEGDVLKQFVDDIIGKQPALEHFGISKRDINSNAILEQMGLSLANYNNIERVSNVLCIKLALSGYKRRYEKQIFQIINKLSGLKIKKWCFKISYDRLCDKVDVAHLQNELDKMKMETEYVVSYQFKKDNKRSYKPHLDIVVSN